MRKMQIGQGIHSSWWFLMPTPVWSCSREATLRNSSRWCGHTGQSTTLRYIYIYIVILWNMLKYKWSAFPACSRFLTFHIHSLHVLTLPLNPWPGCGRLVSKSSSGTSWDPSARQALTSGRCLGHANLKTKHNFLENIGTQQDPINLKKWNFKRSG